MDGLLSGVLPAVYSKADAIKRGLLDLIQNPAASMQQTAGGILDAQRQQSATMDQAFADQRRPLRVTDPNALAQATQNMMAGPLGFAPVGMTVWHGSPHTFSKFDASKIGTGEGAQAYGHGLYLAESKGVAQSYKDALANPSSPLNDAAKYWRQNGGESAFKEFAKNAGIDKRQIEETVNAINGGGALYKVDLPDEAIAKMLDWDKPISDQPKAVKDALERIGGPFTKQALKSGQSRGGQVYMTDLQNDFSDALAATKALQEAGIPGIRYLDQGSRGIGQGTSNFVVFPGNESLLKILERNGQAIR